MVDFNNEAILSTDKYHIIHVLVQQRLAEVIDAKKEYDKKTLQNSNTPTNVLKAYIMAFFNQIEANLEQTDEKAYSEIKEKIDSNKLDNMWEAFKQINTWLYKSKSISFVRKKEFDPENPFDYDRSRGLE